MHDFTVYDIFQRNARIFPSSTALTGMGCHYTFKELLARSNDLATGLAAHGLKKGDRMAVLARNDPRFFVLFGAAALLGYIELIGC
ncbi:unnamed protein product, partial [marine sediment metagenome]